VKRFIVTVLEILICFLLQTTVFQWFALAHVTPNLLLILTVAAGLMHGRTQGITMGFVCGILIDFCYGNVLGLYALIYMLIGYLNGYGKKILMKDDLTIPVFLVGISQFIYFFLFYVFEFLLNGKLNFMFYLVRMGLPQIVYTVVVSIVLYKILNIINTRLERKEEKG